MSSVSCTNLTKKYYNNVLAVDHLNLEIKDKEFLVLTGPSGCGKTSLLRLIAGLEDIEEGDIYIGDCLVNTIPSKDRNLAMVSQEYALYPHMTVYQNLAFSLTIRKMDPEEIDILVHRAARLLELESLLYRKPKTLSGGQLQRVALGRAIVREPAVFLLDEPLSNLDIKFRNSMRLQISRLHKQLNTTFIYVTHDQAEAMSMADRIVVMKDGVIMQVGTPHEIYHSPANLFVAGFFGQPQMSFIDGYLLEKNRRIYVKINGYEIPVSGEYEKFQIYLNRQVILGIRPEDLSADSALLSDTPETVFKAMIEKIDMTGADQYLSVLVNNSRLTAKVPSDLHLKAGEMIHLAVNTAHIHLFNPTTEKAIL